MPNPDDISYSYEHEIPAALAVKRARETIRRRGLRTIEALALNIAHQSGEVARATRDLQVDGIGLEGIQYAARELAALAIQLDASVQREIEASAQQDQEEGGAACAPV